MLNVTHQRAACNAVSVLFGLVIRWADILVLSLASLLMLHAEVQ